MQILIYHNKQETDKTEITQLLYDDKEFTIFPFLIPLVQSKFQ